MVEDNIEEEKIRFLEILQSIDYFKEKLFNKSKIEIKDTSILEIFIQFFIEEVESIIKKGLIYKYNIRSENMNIFKGKLDIDNHIKYNFSHKEKFYVKFDEFSVNSLENIFIKMTIQKLKKVSVNFKNKERLKKIEHHFENVVILDDSLDNLKYITFDRMNNYYRNAIQWAKIFLNNQSSSIFSTNNGEITSILFPMENIFENYIINKLRNIIQEKYYNQFIIKAQDNSCSIFSNIELNNTEINSDILRIKPDIVIKNKDTKEIFILDTKWKVLNKSDDKFKISTEDIYQMFTYVKTYNDRSKNYICKKAYLIYPATNMNKNTFNSKDKLIFSTDNFELNIVFVDLSSEKNIEKDLINILENFKSWLESLVSFFFPFFYSLCYNISRNYVLNKNLKNLKGDIMKKLTTKIQVLYALGVSYAIVDQIFAQWILYFYLPSENSGLKPFMAPILVSIALAVSRFVDMITDPLVGFLSDKYNSKYGRRIPFVAVGTIPLILVTIAFFYPPTSSERASFYYLMIVGSLFFTFYTIVGAPYNALIPEIGRTSEERLNLSTWQSVFRLSYTAIAIILPGILIKMIGGDDVLFGIRGMIIFLCVIVFIGLTTTVFTVRERDYSTGEVSNVSFKDTIGIIIKNKNFILYLFGMMFFFIGFNNLRAIMNYYVEDIMGYGKKEITIASALLFGAAAICFYPTNKLSKKYGYRKIMLCCLAMLIVTTSMLFFLGKVFPVNFGFVLFGIIGIPLAGAAFIFPPAMLSEISTQISEDSGARIEGLSFGIQGFFMKTSFLISIVTLPIILVMGNDVSIISAITSGVSKVEKTGIYLASLSSVFFFIISFIFYYKYSDSKKR